MPVAPIWICPFCKKEIPEDQLPEDKKCPECKAPMELKK